jgi:hypothetical protein
VGESAVLDVVLGLSFLFFVLSLVCAAVNEMVAAAAGRRGRTLRRGICVLLDSKAEADDIYQEPLIKSLYKGKRLPSYIPAHRFAQTIVDRYAPELLEVPPRDPDFAKVPSARTRDALTSLWRHAGGDLVPFRADVGQWFDDTMKRTSGWYRRRADVILIGLAVVVTVALNVNAIGVAQRLWADSPVRAAVAATNLAADPAVQDPALTHDRLQQLRTEYRRLDASRLPLGWSRDARPDPLWVGMIGWLLSVLAISLGAPFWFDLLGKVASLRTAGKREDPK